MRIHVLLCSLAIFVAGCSGGDSGDPNAEARADFEVARTKWESTLIDDYEFNYEYTCRPVCPEPSDVNPRAGFYRVKVENGERVSAYYLGSNEVATEGQLSHLGTVTTLFEALEDGFDYPADSIEARYDSEYGYPLSIEIDLNSAASDDDMSFAAGDLTVLPD